MGVIGLWAPAHCRVGLACCGCLLPLAWLGGSLVLTSTSRVVRSASDEMDDASVERRVHHNPIDLH